MNVTLYVEHLTFTR